MRNIFVALVISIISFNSNANCEYGNILEEEGGRHQNLFHTVATYKNKNKIKTNLKNLTFRRNNIITRCSGDNLGKCLQLSTLKIGDNKCQLEPPTIKIIEDESNRFLQSKEDEWKPEHTMYEITYSLCPSIDFYPTMYNFESDKEAVGVQEYIAKKISKDELTQRFNTDKESILKVINDEKSFSYGGDYENGSLSKGFTITSISATESFEYDENNYFMFLKLEIPAKFFGFEKENKDSDFYMIVTKIDGKFHFFGNTMIGRCTDSYYKKVDEKYERASRSNFDRIGLPYIPFNHVSFFKLGNKIDFIEVGPRSDFDGISVLYEYDGNSFKVISSGCDPTRGKCFSEGC